MGKGGREGRRDREGRGGAGGGGGGRAGGRRGETGRDRKEDTESNLEQPSDARERATNSVDQRQIHLTWDANARKRMRNFHECRTLAQSQHLYCCCAVSRFVRVFYTLLCNVFW